MLGGVRQAVSRGLKTATVFERVRDQLRACPEVSVTGQAYERAAGFFSVCHNEDTRGRSTDFLIRL